MIRVTVAAARNIRNVMGPKIVKSAGGVVVNVKGEVIVVDQNGNSWSLPKGHLEAGEDSLSAARREIYEETGVKNLVLVKELGSYERFPTRINDEVEDYAKLKSITLFLFRTDEVALKPIDPNNHEARWVAKEKVAELLTHPKDKDFFLSILKEI